MSNKDSAGLETQLQEMAVLLATQVAELLSIAAKSIDNGAQKEKINEMIENDLPTVICNTLMKTPALHSQGGINHLRENLGEYSEKFAHMFLRND
jgi:hypothetical protein